MESSEPGRGTPKRRPFSAVSSAGEALGPVRGSALGELQRLSRVCLHAPAPSPRACLPSFWRRKILSRAATCRAVAKSALRLEDQALAPKPSRPAQGTRAGRQERLRGCIRHAGYCCTEGRGLPTPLRPAGQGLSALLQDVQNKLGSLLQRVGGRVHGAGSGSGQVLPIP